MKLSPHGKGDKCTHDENGWLINDVKIQIFVVLTATLHAKPTIITLSHHGLSRSFGFEKYWEQKQLENARTARRRLNPVDGLQDMSQWILGDPTATNLEECAEYVARADSTSGGGMFAHGSEHASFQILTPLGTVRLSHGR